MTMQARKILRLRQVEEKTGLKKSTLYALMNVESPRFDPTFPRSIPIGIRAVGWDQSEIENWIAARMAMRPNAPIRVQPVFA